MSTDHPVMAGEVAAMEQHIVLTPHGLAFGMRRRVATAGAALPAEAEAGGHRPAPSTSPPRRWFGLRPLFGTI